MEHGSIGDKMAPMTGSNDLRFALPAALLLDVDGTMIDFAPRPDAVVVPRHLIELLAALHDRLDGAVALVSGRSIDTLDSLFAPLRLPSVGLHGLERRLTYAAPVERMPIGRPSWRLLQAVQQAANRYDSAFVEDKQLTLAVHHRLMKDSTALLHRELQQACEAEGGDWATLRGRQVIELKPRCATKGHGSAALLSGDPFAGRHAIAFGDDTTDLDMFDTVRRLGGTTISVGPRIARAGDFKLAAPRQVLALLQALGEALAQGRELLPLLPWAIDSARAA